MHDEDDALLAREAPGEEPVDDDRMHELMAAFCEQHCPYHRSAAQPDAGAEGGHRTRGVFTEEDAHDGKHGLRPVRG